MSDLLFDNFRQWRVCLWSGVCKAAWGLWRIVTCFLFGVVSVFVFCFKQIGAFCKREFVASLIIGVIGVVLFVSFGLTFVQERKARLSAEMQRDSVSYELSRITGQ